MSSPVVHIAIAIHPFTVVEIVVAKEKLVSEVVSVPVSETSIGEPLPKQLRHAPMPASM
jgi:hypothetical protein